MYKTKTERDLVYEANKDIIRAQVRYEATSYYKQKSNLMLDLMTKRFLELESEGEMLRLGPDLPDSIKAQIEADVEQMLQLTQGS